MYTQRDGGEIGVYVVGWTIHPAKTEKTMERRKFLVGVGSTSIGGSALVGSVAFSRVESQRAVTIQVAEDEYAYLGLMGCPDSPNQSYTGDDGKGHLTVDMTPENPTEAGGQGVNSDSSTWFDRVFQICNNGKKAACIWIEDDENWPVVPKGWGEHTGERRVEFYLEDERDTTIIGEENAIALEVSDCVCVGIRTRTYSLSEEDHLLEELDDEIRIIADDDCPDVPDIPGEENDEEPPDDDEDPVPRTIGFWSNWSGECTPGGQWNYLGETLEGAGIELGDLPVTKADHATPPKCGAVKLLLKRDLDDNVRANDGAYGLASQLLAAKLNRAAGAEVPDDTECGDIGTQIDDGQKLLYGIGFEGTGSHLPPGAEDRQDALDIAECLDRYNKGEFTE